MIDLIGILCVLCLNILDGLVLKYQLFMPVQLDRLLGFMGHCESRCEIPMVWVSEPSSQEKSWRYSARLPTTIERFPTSVLDRARRVVEGKELLLGQDAPLPHLKQIIQEKGIEFRCPYPQEIRTGYLRAGTVCKGSLRPGGGYIDWHELRRLFDSVSIFLVCQVCSD